MRKYTHTLVLLYCAALSYSSCTVWQVNLCYCYWHLNRAFIMTECVSDLICGNVGLFLMGKVIYMMYPHAFSQLSNMTQPHRISGRTFCEDHVAQRQAFLKTRPPFCFSYLISINKTEKKTFGHSYIIDSTLVFKFLFQNTNGVNFYNILTQNSDMLKSSTENEGYLCKIHFYQPIRNIFPGHSPNMVNLIEYYGNFIITGIKCIDIQLNVFITLFSVTATLKLRHVQPLHGQSLDELMNGPIREKLGIIPKNVTWGGKDQLVNRFSTQNISPYTWHVRALAVTIEMITFKPHVYINTSWK